MRAKVDVGRGHKRPRPEGYFVDAYIQKNRAVFERKMSKATKQKPER